MARELGTRRPDMTEYERSEHDHVESHVGAETICSVTEVYSRKQADPRLPQSNGNPAFKWFVGTLECCMRVKR